ncbi:hypothetical protein SAMN04487998_0487 [Hymenobacter actinosclerus]|uniref:Uncharacterized protein n=1 Tax=Hymenobacter actinosclerus TaxID=82805 RepID=A0A1H9ZVH3_9BACT|nr:hypothetical protein SAMN04487998_0487 [Hymenobacter actinosclerus]
MPFTATTPRSYGTARGWRVFIYLVTPPMIVVFLICPFLFDSDQSLLVYGPIGAVMWGMAGLFSVLLYDVYKGRHTFSAQGIRYRGAFRSKDLPLAAIKGYRTDDNYTYIVPVSRQYRGIRIGYTSEGYAEIQQWLAARFPDLDAQQVQQDAERLLLEEDFGRNPAEREANLAGARHVSWVLNAAGCLSGAWLLFWPEPYDWAVWAGLGVPPLAAAALFWHRGLLCFDDSNHSARPAITAALLFPPLGLLLRGLFDFELLAYQPLAPYAAGTALLMATALVLGSPQLLATSGRRVLLTGGIMAVLYGAAAVVTVNCVFDTSGPRVYAVPVLDKQLSGGQTSSYYLNVGPWGARAQPENVEVSKTLYQQTVIGDTVHIYQRPGRLGAAWFSTGK